MRWLLRPKLVLLTRFGIMASLPRPSAAPTPQRTTYHFLDPDLDQAGVRWRRFALRLVARYDWNREGLRLWLVRHPGLRWLPFPYPSVASPDAWRSQATAMVETGCYPRFDDVVWKPRWTQLRVPGGPDLAGHAGSQVHTWPGDSAQERWPQGRSSQGGSRVRSTQSCSKPSWTKGRLPDAQGGLGQACGASARDRGRQGHHPNAQEEAEADDRRPAVADAQGRANDFEQAIVDYVNIPGAFAELTPDVLHDYNCRPAGFLDGSRLKPCRECCHATATCAADGQPTGSHGPAIPRHVRPTPPARDGQATAEPRRHDGGAARLGAGRTTVANINDAAGHLGDHAATSTSPRSSSGSSGLPRLKNGQKQLITQAWERHRCDQLLVSCAPGRLRDVMTAEFFASYAKGMQDVFVMEVPTICTEIYSDTEPVTRMARQRGHTTGPTLTLDTGWERALQQVRDTKPYFLVLAFPCGPWSQLQNLSTPPDRLQQLRAQALPLVRFAAQLAREQNKAGRHFLLEILWAALLGSFRPFELFAPPASRSPWTCAALIFVALLAFDIESRPAW